WSWINAAADRFERAWKQGPRPRIEDFLAEVDESRWPRLLQELLRVESELRRRAGEQPNPEEYHLRFPGSAALIDALFRRDPAPPRSALGPMPRPGPRSPPVRRPAATTSRRRQPAPRSATSATTS